MLEQLLSTYGYLAIAIGTFLEGETILVLGGFAAHRGYLDLNWVITWAFLGTLLGDQLYYFIGRHKGKGVLEKRPGWKSKSEKVFRMLEQHQIKLMLGFRFFYGLRTVTPFLIGASNITPQRFLVWNIAGAAIWAVTVGVLGYLFGHTLEIIIEDIKHYELQAFLIIVAAGFILWWTRGRIKKQK